MNIYDITDFGAVADGKTVNTSAIQRAIDECENGGIVYIPEGEFVSGALFLKGNITLKIDGKLIGSGHCGDYPIFTYRFEGLEQPCYASLINAGECENIIISGNGTIDANGVILREGELAENKGKPGRAVCIKDTKNISICDVTVRQSPAWCVHLIYCENIKINNVKIHTKYDEDGNRYDNIINGDGIDIDSCRNVEIIDSMVSSQDDCIAIKSGRDEEGRKIGIASENITVMNCRFKSGFGVAVGSEMSGGVKNVLVKNCEFTDTFSIASIKAPRGRGGKIENIRYESCKMINRSTEHHDCEWFRGGLYVDAFYSHVEFDADTPEEISDGTPTFDNIYFKDIELETVGGSAVYLCGLPERPIGSVTLENVRAKGKRGLTVRNVKALSIKNALITSR